jgi:hypothetical protein
MKAIERQPECHRLLIEPSGTILTL